MLSVAPPMPRRYKRKSDIGSTPPAQMKRAASEVVDNGRTLRAVAGAFSIPRSTLSRYVTRYRSDPEARMEPAYRHSRVFTNEQEGELKEYVLRCSEMFYGLTAVQTRELAFEMAQANGVTPDKWKDNGIAGIEWLNGFLERHPELALRKPEATSLARCSAFNRHNVSAFFDALEEALTVANVNGHRIFNLDETGCTTVQRPPRVLARKGSKQVAQVTSQERGELVTMVGIVSATGMALPPVYIFPRKNMRESLMTGAPEGALGIPHQTGWMTKENFVKVIDHFVKYAHSCKQSPTVLVMDNHVSHVSLGALEHAKKNGVYVVTLPPHTSQKTQPLDRSVFGPLKTFFNAEANALMMRQPGSPITIYQMAALIGSAWMKAATPVNITAGFRASGIWPLNRWVFGDEAFLPSQVTDVEQPGDVEDGAAGRPAAVAEGLPLVERGAVAEGLPLVDRDAVSEGLPLVDRGAVSEGLPLVERGAVAEGLPLVEPAAVAEGLPLVERAAIAEGLPLVEPAAVAEGLPLVERGAVAEGLPLVERGVVAEDHPPPLEKRDTVLLSISPEEVRGYPKAKAGEGGRKRRARGSKARFANSSPELKRMRMAEMEAKGKKACGTKRETKSNTPKGKAVGKKSGKTARKLELGGSEVAFPGSSSDVTCIICGMRFDRSAEEWIQCVQCHCWACLPCTDVEKGQVSYQCDLCRE